MLEKKSRMQYTRTSMENLRGRGIYAALLLPTADATIKLPVKSPAGTNPMEAQWDSGQSRSWKPLLLLTAAKD